MLMKILIFVQLKLHAQIQTNSLILTIKNVLMFAIMELLDMRVIAQMNAQLQQMMFMLILKLPFVWRLKIALKELMEINSQKLVLNFAQFRHQLLLIQILKSVFQTVIPSSLIIQLVHVCKFVLKFPSFLETTLPTLASTNAAIYHLLMKQSTYAPKNVLMDILLISLLSLVLRNVLKGNLETI